VNLGREVGAASWLVLANCSLPLDGIRRGAGRVCHRSTRRGLLFEVVQDPFHPGGVIDAGDHLDGTAAVLAGFDIDPEHTLETLGPGHGGASLSWGLGFVRGSFAPVLIPG
jgi:hypothetical protein